MAQSPGLSLSSPQRLVLAAAASDDTRRARRWHVRRAVGRSGTHRALPLVLIVDDSTDTREVYAACLRSAGYRTEQADNGLAGLEKAREMSPAIVVLDYQMPVLDGLEAARRMKADPGTAGIPLILVSSFDLEGRDHCFDCSLTKPCFPEHLVAAIEASLAASGGASSRGS